MEISNLSNEDLRIMVLKMLTELRKMSEHRENFNNEMGNIKKEPTRTEVFGN